MKKVRAYFTVEAALLYPVVLGVILLMGYLLFFQYDRCLMEQEVGRASVRAGGSWWESKERLQERLKKEILQFDTEKYIAWDTEEPRWKQERNTFVLEQAGRLRYPFVGLGISQEYWSAKTSVKVTRDSPVFWIRRYRKLTEEK